MRQFINKIKKTAISFMVLALTASLGIPSIAFAAEVNPEVQIENHTTERSDAREVSCLSIGDVTAPKPGVRLDEKAAVTTAEKETWEIPVIWIGEDLEPDTGLAGEGSYLPVLAFVVPEEYTVVNDENQRGYTVKLSEDLLKMFGDSGIISIYEEKTEITYILPMSLKDLYAPKTAAEAADYSVEEEPIPAEEVATPAECAEEESREQKPEKPEPEHKEEKEPQKEPEKKPEPEKEQEPEKEPEKSDPIKHLINLHCDEKARKALSEEDLGFLADLLINKLHPQAVNLLTEKFPALGAAVKTKALGQYINLLITFDASSGAYGHASCGWTDDKTYPDNTFAYKLTIESGTLVQKGSDGGLQVIRDFDSDEMKDLSNTLVHELLHIVMYDYNRTGMVGRRMTTDGTLSDYETAADFPIWFKEGTASSVENNWQEREKAFAYLRMDFDHSTLLDYYNPDVLLNNYIKGIYRTENGKSTSLFFYDLECCDGKDHDGEECDTVASRYVSGYLATLYLGELAARSSGIGSSEVKNGLKTTYDSEKIRLGLNYILESLHGNEDLNKAPRTLDEIIREISGGRYSSTDDFEARFIKGQKDNGSYTGDADSLQFIGDLMNYFREIDRTEGRTNKLANGSILFSFDQDFAAPLDFGKEASSNILQVLDSEEETLINFVRSTVPESKASATGGKSVAGEAPSGNSNDSKVTAFPAQETNDTQQAAKETSEAVSTEVALTAESPVEEFPAEEVMAEVAATEEIAAEEGPADETPAVEVPAEEVPTEEVPTEEVPEAEAPSEEAGTAATENEAEEEYGNNTGEAESEEAADSLSGPEDFGSENKQ